ncbi:SH3 domain-containing protein [Clostridium swellfunianum]|uniref:SH3 domain-containing protein n=1 Tax=Clostridium swellfunianum TaxID=1367462 RepID=UPI00202FBDF8|nr:SH3 domain-containing protein [Clostridium swellfunianum]MCM0648620.1 SH3 domain-containing protein [Clostridium swellfunianum]
MSYQITEKFISKNRSGKVLTAKGTVLHETATPGATAENEFRYFNGAYRGVSAHAFVDHESIIQTVPWNEQAWHAGGTANRNYIGIELCNFDDRSKFDEIWKRAVWLFAYVHVNVIKVTTINKDTLMSHAEVSAKWKETTHQDPIAYFAKFGKTVDQFREGVQKAINVMIGQPQQQQNNNTVLYGTVTADVLNVRDGASTNFGVIGKLKKGERIKLGWREGNWWNIYFGDHGGWVSADYINVFEEEPKPKIQYGIVNVKSSLNVRSGAGTNYSLIGNLKNGVKVRIGSTEGDWYNIYFGDHGGYVNKDYIKLV